MDRRRARISWLLWAAVLVVSLAWMAAFFLYVEEAIGWQNAVNTLLPHEMAVLVLALVLPPLLLVTLIAAFRGQMAVHVKEEMIDRLPAALDGAGERATAALTGALADFDRRTGEMRHELSDASGRLSELVQSLARQAVELDKFNDLTDRLARERMGFDAVATPRLAELGDLERKTDQLRLLVEQAVNVSRMTIAGLGEASQGMSGVLNDVIAEARGQIEAVSVRMRDALRAELASLNEVPQQFGDKVTAAGEDIRQRIAGEVGSFDQAVGHAFERAGEVGSALRGALQSEIAGLDQVVDHALARTSGAALQLRGELESHLGAINSVIDQSLARTGGAGEQLRGALDNHLGAIHTAVDQALARSGSAGEQLRGELERQVAAFAAALDQAVAQVGQSHETARQALVGEGERLSAVADAAGRALGTRMSELAAGLSRHLQGYSGAMDALLAKVSNVTAEFDKQSQAVGDAAQKAAERGVELGEAFNRQSAGLSGAATRAEAAAASVREVLQKETQSLDAALAQSSQRIDGINERMHERIRLLDAAADAAGSKIAVAGELFRREVAALSSASNQTLGDFDAMGQALHEHGKSLAQHGEQVRSLVGNLSGDVARLEKVLERQGGDIGEVAQGVVARIEAVNAALADHTRGLTHAAAAAIEQSAAVGDTLREQSDAMHRAIENLIDRAPALGALLQQQTQTLIGNTDDAVSRITEIAELFGQQKDMMDGAWQESLSGLRELGDSISKELASLTVASDDAAQRMTEVGDAFAARARQINLAVDTASNRAGEAGSALATRIEQWAGRLKSLLDDTDGAVDRMTAQADALQQASRQALEQAEQIRAADMDVRRDSFLQSATEIMAQLNAAAVDVSRLLNDGIPAEAWAKYQAGDRGFFARRLLKIKDEGAIPIVRQKYHADSDFRAHVDRFIRQFEKLEERALQIDSDKLLHQAFMTADIGKVYILLSEALGRRN